MLPPLKGKKGYPEDGDSGAHGVLCRSGKEQRNIKELEREHWS